MAFLWVTRHKFQKSRWVSLFCAARINAVWQTLAIFGCVTICRLLAVAEKASRCPLPTQIFGTDGRDILPQ